MLRIGICDDMYDARQSLKNALERILDRQGKQAVFFDFSSGEGILRWLKNHIGELDLVFLDMEMGKLDGIAAAKRLRELDEGLQLVFVTAYSDRVFDGYTVGALGYILKPPEQEQLEDILARCSSVLERGQERMFICRSGDIIYRIPVSGILYFYSDRRKVFCITKQRKYGFYGKLDEVALELKEGFVRIHQRYLVRSSAVARVSDNEVSINGETLPVSRSCRKAALLALTRASLGE